MEKARLERLAALPTQQVEQEVTVCGANASPTEDYDPFKQGIEPLGCDPDELEF